MPCGRHPLKMVRLPISPLPLLTIPKENAKATAEASPPCIPPDFHWSVSVVGIEPTTLCLKGRCSTTELHARMGLVNPAKNTNALRPYTALTPDAEKYKEVAAELQE